MYQGRRTLQAAPKSTAQLKAWIEDTAGIEVDSLNKKNIAAVRSKALELFENGITYF